MCDAIYIGKTQKTFKKRMDGHLSDILHLIKNRKKLDSFAVDFRWKNQQKVRGFFTLKIPCQGL